MCIRDRSDGSQKINLDEEQRTEIVAYLDGELDEAASARVRKLLAQNVEARRAAEELTIAWEALDALDYVTASDTFTERTLTSIKALAETDTGGATQAFDLKRGTVLGGLLLGLLSCAIIGFCLANWSVPEKSQNLVRDLELMRSLPKYQRLGSPELLKELEQRELFNDDQNPQ